MASSIPASLPSSQLPPPKQLHEHSLAIAQSQQKAELDESDIDRFATLFSPSTPPATPTTLVSREPMSASIASLRPQHRRHRTHSSTDDEFGAFVSVPPTQDPLSFDSERGSCVALGGLPQAGARAASSASPGASLQDSTHHGSLENRSLDYFDRFTSHARVAAERNKHSILDELLEHQDDPLYFLNLPSDAHPSPPATPPPPLSPPLLPPTKFAPPPPLSAMRYGDMEEALTSELVQQKPITRVQSKSDLRGVLASKPVPVRTGTALPPRLSGSTSPPSVSSPPTSSPSSPPPPPPPATTAQIASTPPAYDTLSRLSSGWVSSFLPSSRPRSSTHGLGASATLPPTPSSAPSTFSPALNRPITRGTPFGSTPYIPPSGAPGFAGDRAWDKGFSEALARDEALGTRKGVSLVGRHAGTTEVLSEEMADLIRPRLPALTRLSRHWTLLYSIDQHGISLNTLYSRCEPRIPTKAVPNPPQGALVAVKDARDAVFGVWLAEGIRQERGYYGSGESCVWNAQERKLWTDETSREAKLDVYNWTGRNDYVALCEPEFISFGGGDGRYGLYIDASLLEGSSVPCATFDNLVLCGGGGANGIVGRKKDVNFECVGLEVWGVGPG
ncbi:TLD-domain-containing protein [Phlebopus sp. FC_14]|nr:TLD-domain-containing protein [Phlebopus sp. FC_14]